jgi:hypothetical protein
MMWCRTHNSIDAVIARSEATKQSRLSQWRRSGLLRYARNDGAWTEAYPTLAVTIQIAPGSATLLPVRNGASVSRIEALAAAYVSGG